MATTFALSDYWAKKLIEVTFGATAVSAPGTLYFGAMGPNKGKWAASTVYSASDYVIPTTANGRIYKTTSGGTSGGSEPTWPTTTGGTVVDGTVTWTEQTASLNAGTGPEVTGGSYGRGSLTNNTTNFPAATLVSGLEQIQNAVAVSNFPTPSGNWGTNGWISHIGIWDASSAGNMLAYFDLTTPVQVTSSATPFSIPINGITFGLG